MIAALSQRPGACSSSQAARSMNALHAHAAMREEAVIAGEQILRRRVVHVNGVRVGHGETQRAQRIARAGILPQRVIRRALARPVHGARIDLLAARVQHANARAREIGRVFEHFRRDLVLDDRHRHGPGRIDVDRHDLGLHLRRMMLHVADDRRVAAYDEVVLHRVDGGRGDIDDDVARAEGKIDAGETLGARGELAEAHGGGNVERAQGGAGDGAGLTQAHAELKALHRLRSARRPRSNCRCRRGRRPRPRAAGAAPRPSRLSTPDAATRRPWASRRHRRSRRNAPTPWRW